MNNFKNIVLVLKSGGDFKFTDVYLLVTHINKYWSAPDRPNIYCYTDLVTEERKVVGLTIRPLPNPQWKGWWSKMNLFSPELKELRPFLYMDLDTAVIGTIDVFFPKKENQNNFITLEDFYRKGKLASGFMWIPNTAYMDKIYKSWISNSLAIMTKFARKGDQGFIETIVKANFFWQKIFAPLAITTFKPNRQWRREMPYNSTVVCFHGKPRIPEAAKTVEWVENYVSYGI